ncbi:MAG: hypothetical protein IT427_17290, partial [Pirellulales bacterium]|nr:hypothetical protein [Pirellulales bacterium]
GVAPFAGFWSKDAILGAVHDRAHHATGFAHHLYSGLYWVGMLTAGLTAFYTFRGFFLTFFGKEQIPPEAGHHAHEAPHVMTVPLLILAFLAVTIGWYFTWTGGVVDFLRHTPSLAYKTIADTTGTQPSSHGDVMLVSTAFALLGVALAAYLYLGSSAQATLMARLFRPLYWLSYRKFFLDEIYQKFIVWPLQGLAAVSDWFDRYVIDALANLVGAFPGAVGWLLRSLQNGMVQFYALAMILGLLVLIGTLALWPAG